MSESPQSPPSLQLPQSPPSPTYIGSRKLTTTPVKPIEYETRHLTQKDFKCSGKQMPEPPLCIYENIRYGVSYKYRHEEKNIKRRERKQSKKLEYNKNENENDEDEEDDEDDENEEDGENDEDGEDDENDEDGEDDSIEINNLTDTDPLTKPKSDLELADDLDNESESGSINMPGMSPNGSVIMPGMSSDEESDSSSDEESVSGSVNMPGVSPDGSIDESNVQTIHQMMGDEYGLMKCSTLFLPNNKNVFFSFGSKFNNSGVADMLNYCKRNKIYPQTKALMDFIKKRTGKDFIFTIAENTDLCFESDLQFKIYVHTNMVYNDFIPDNETGKLTFELVNTDKTKEARICIETLCKLNGLDQTELENFLISELEKYYANPSVFKFQVFCGCCFQSYIPDPNEENKKNGHSDQECIIC
jgi:hypothetical protein